MRRVCAQELHLKGAAIVCPTISVVVAEGSAKAMKKFNALMMRRIAWDARQEDADEEAPADR